MRAFFHGRLGGDSRTSKVLSCNLYITLLFIIAGCIPRESIRLQEKILEGIEKGRVNSLALITAIENSELKTRTLALNVTAKEEIQKFPPANAAAIANALVEFNSAAEKLRREVHELADEKRGQVNVFYDQLTRLASANRDLLEVEVGSSEKSQRALNKVREAIQEKYPEISEELKHIP